MIKKSLCIALLIGLLITPALSQEIDWTVANEITVGWDEVTTTVEGNAVPEEDLIKYELFLVDANSTTRFSDRILVGETELLRYTYTFPSEGKWIAGVRAVRVIADYPDQISTSIISWSDGDHVGEAGKFGFLYFVAPIRVSGFGPK